jgi:hypothetical protein
MTAKATINVAKHKGGGSDPHCNLKRECENADKSKQSQNVLLIHAGITFNDVGLGYAQDYANRLRAEKESLEDLVAKNEQKIARLEAEQDEQIRRELRALREWRIRLAREESEQAELAKEELKTKEVLLKEKKLKSRNLSRKSRRRNRSY